MTAAFEDCQGLGAGVRSTARPPKAARCHLVPPCLPPTTHPLQPPMSISVGKLKLDL